MNTAALKPFAQQARKLLREGVERRLSFWGFDKKGAVTATVEFVGGGYTFRGKVYNDTTVPRKWNRLKAAVQHSSFDEVVERAAYTWFNRLLAMKILSKNGYETTQLDYLTLDTHTPAILERARRGQFGFLSTHERDRLQPLLTDYEREEEAFALLLIGYNHQHPLLHRIFGCVDDYTELLLPDDILTKNGFLHYLNTTTAISDDDYKQVELIGWLYQFYISEKKDEVFAGFKQNKKAEAKDIPAATQIFTPNWIVKYLVQNTLGRTWLDRHLESELKNDWKYLVDPSQQQEATNAGASSGGWEGALETLTFLDPAVGSGHILVEAFDTLYPMYMAEFYSPDEAVQSILQHNLFGLDLDQRAAQLAQFALILKAARYSRTVLQGGLLPHIYAMPQHRSFSREEVTLFLGNELTAHTNALYKVLQIMEEAHNLGSIMVLELGIDLRKAIESRYRYWISNTARTVEEEIVKEVFPAYVPILLTLTNKFSCIACNPPYMGQKTMNAGLKNYINNEYPLTKVDLFAVFMDVCGKLLKDDGRYSMINQHGWMFLSSYENFRVELLSKAVIENMLHLGPRAFDEVSGEVVQNTAFTIFKRAATDAKGTYYRLVNCRSSNEKNIAFEQRRNEYSSIVQHNFFKIPGCPIAYWVSDNFIKAFLNGVPFEDVANPRQGLGTGNNERFIRNWHEVSSRKVYWNAKDRNDAIMSEKKWFSYTKGAGFKKWYGRGENVVNWENDGQEIRAALQGMNPNIPRSESLYFRKGISWGLISTDSFSCREILTGGIFDVTGSMAFPSDKDRSYLLALLNSSISRKILAVLNPTISYQVGDIKRIPVIFSGGTRIKELSEFNVQISKFDWDSRETSWDYRLNPIIETDEENLEKSFNNWRLRVSGDFFHLHANEEELNRNFIDIYSLQDELTPDVPLKDITILQEELDYDKLSNLQKPFDGQLVPIHADVVMQQMISYVIGCYMGRYRLDKAGLHIAHPNPTEEELQPYPVSPHFGVANEQLFTIDDDAIIPLMGGNGGFTDDMLQRLKEFLSIVWGDENLTVNLNFLQQQLGKDLEDYLVKDFWKDHTRTYNKKPIYWLFASKKGAFQVLVYMHRMNAYTVGKIRSKYLIPHISWLQAQVRDMEKNAATLGRAGLKLLDIRRKQLVECEEYDLLLKDVADKRITFDLDDGVTKNYALFKGVVADIK